MIRLVDGSRTEVWALVVGEMFLLRSTKICGLADPIIRADADGMPKWITPPLMK